MWDQKYKLLVQWEDGKLDLMDHSVTLLALIGLILLHNKIFLAHQVQQLVEAHQVPFIH
jgi:hypothetical protein